jgi:hypothetical protein
MWMLQKLKRRWFGYKVFWMSWERRMRTTFYIVIVKVPFFFFCDLPTLCEEPGVSFKNKKYTIKVSLIQSVLESGQLLLEKIRGTKNSADMLTK